jgi:hypothetical protein
MVEAKIIGNSRHKVRETISQLDNWDSYANFLWAGFARSEWRALDQRERTRYEDDLKRQGMGLMLVEKETVEVIVDPKTNSGVVQTNQLSLLESIGLEIPSEVIPHFDLSRKTALVADSAICWCYDIFQNEARDIAGQGKKRTPPPEYDLQDHQFVWDGWYSGSCAITADPFGSLVGNGITAILVWKAFNRLDEPFECIDSLLPGAFLWVLNDVGEAKVQPFLDVDRDALKQSGFTHDPWLLWQVGLSGRTREGVVLEIRKVWKLVRSSKKKSK